MTLPYPAHTALLGETDLFIKALAFAVDAKLGTGLRYVATSGSYTVNAGGDITVLFPLNSAPVGAIVLPQRLLYVTGQVSTLDPVPPSSVGRILPTTPFNVYPWGYGVGAVNCAVRTMASRISPPASGISGFYGSQPVKSGTSVPVCGIAWGPS